MKTISNKDYEHLKYVNSCEYFNLQKLSIILFVGIVTTVLLYNTKRYTSHIMMITLQYCIHLLAIRLQELSVDMGICSDLVRLVLR